MHRKLPDYDEILIQVWFLEANKFIPGLADDLERLFDHLTFAHLLPVLELFEALMRHGHLEHIKSFDKTTLVKAPADLIGALAAHTTKHGEIEVRDSGKIEACYKSLELLVDELDEKDSLYEPYMRALELYRYVAAYAALQQPAGKKIREAHFSGYLIPEVVSEKMPQLKLVVSNGETIE